jgi:3'-phosphoadenosine 5'-phosphosulfate sulfotransferase (PAPS reductase)/FAD synthetase
MKPIYIASCSFGKDSIATILLALENNEPLDRVVFAEVMFDNERGISGEIPEHIEWVRSTAIPKIEAMGVPVNVVRGERDYRYYFSCSITRGRHKGKFCGFPLGGMCFINRDCKVGAIKRYYKQLGASNQIVTYIGIAKDEPSRLGRIDGSRKISLLDKYGYTEAMARAKCEEYGLLSPIYKTGTRNGCWFCPNCSLKQFSQFRKQHPDLWAELRELSHTPNLCSYGFKYGKTFQEVEARMDWDERQLKLF